jgi:hypothetical protein
MDRDQEEEQSTSAGREQGNVRVVDRSIEKKGRGAMQAVHRREEAEASTRSWSPEAELGMRVEDIWGSLDEQQDQLSRSDRLNSLLRQHPRRVLPAHLEAVDRIVSAPVRNVDVAEDASWINRYIGIVEFAGIAVWLGSSTRFLLLLLNLLPSDDSCMDQSLFCCFLSLKRLRQEPR